MCDYTSDLYMLKNNCNQRNKHYHKRKEKKKRKKKYKNAVKILAAKKKE